VLRDKIQRQSQWAEDGKLFCLLKLLRSSPVFVENQLRANAQFTPRFDPSSLDSRAPRIGGTPMWR
jgi:hypothetical protein